MSDDNHLGTPESRQAVRQVLANVDKLAAAPGTHVDRLRLQEAALGALAAKDGFQL